MATEKKKIIIIGAGMAGLAAGIYGQKNGFVTEIYEKNPNPGGLCVGWKRDGMEIDGCIHWLTGTQQGTQLYDLWQDLGAFTDEEIIKEDNFGTVDYNGTKIVFYSDLNRLEQELIEISPEDKKEIKRLVRYIIDIQNMPLPIHLPMNLMSPKGVIQTGLGFVPYLNAYLKTNSSSVEKYAKKFKSEAIRYAITHIIPGDSNLYSTLYAYGTVCVGNGGVPKGGSNAIVKNVVNKYKESGGYINYCSPVKSIIVEKNVAKGIVLENGKEIRGDYIVPACDCFETIKKLLKDEYIDLELEKRYKKEKIYKIPSSIYVSLRVNLEKLKENGIKQTCVFPTTPFRAGNSIADHVKIREYSNDPTFIDNGDTLVTVLIHQNNFDFPYWKRIYSNRKMYKEEKERIANDVNKAIVNKYPSLDGHVKAIDVVTPVTYERYVNAYKGGYMPFSLTTKSVMLMHKGTISGLKNLYLAGQWTQMPGGLPIAVMSGKFALQRILKKEKKFYKITARKYIIFKK